jgi:hypothetical protein
VAEVVPEPVRVQVHVALPTTAGDHLVDAASGHRPPVVAAQPQLGPAIVVPAARLIHLSAWLRQAAGVFCSVAVCFMARP